MTLKKLSKSQIEIIYRERMTDDFPPDELKPLSMIYKAIDDGRYEFLGLINNSEIVGYVCLLKLGNDYLIDYLAVKKEMRNKGYGGQLIRLISEYLSDASSIILEIEHPSHSESSSERAVKEQRLLFYSKNGFRNTGVTVNCFGVIYLILETGRYFHDEEAIKSLYHNHYKAILPDKMFRENIAIY